MLRAVKDADASRITEIYYHYILNTLITFEKRENVKTTAQKRARAKGGTCRRPDLSRKGHDKSRFRALA